MESKTAINLPKATQLAVVQLTILDTFSILIGAKFSAGQTALHTHQTIGNDLYDAKTSLCFSGRHSGLKFLAVNPLSE